MARPHISGQLFMIRWKQIVKKAFLTPYLVIGLPIVQEWPGSFQNRHGVPCPARGSFCSGNVKIDHRAWIYGCSLMSVLYFVLFCIATAEQSSVCTEILIYFYEKTQKLLPPELLLLAQMHQIVGRLSAGALPQAPVGELAALPIPSSWFRGVAPGEREGGRGGEKEGRKGREWRRGEGRGGSPRMPKSRVGKSIWWPLKISPPKGSSSFQMTDLPSCKLSCRSVSPEPRYLSPDT